MQRFVMSLFQKILTSFSISLIFFVSASQAFAFPNFDFDGKADFAVFRVSDKNWYSLSSELKTFSAVQWGAANDKLVPADYDGDGLTDEAVYRNGNWFIRKSRDGQLFSVKWGGNSQVEGGFTYDEPVAGDFDGDGVYDIAVFRPADGTWYILKSASGFSQNYPLIFKWGKLGDIPVPADYDGDGTTDFAVFRYTETRWYILESRTKQLRTAQFGSIGVDLLVPNDYTGDGKADIAVYRRGNWIFIRSEDDRVENQIFGEANDKPVPADYDNDGIIDFAVFRNGDWFMLNSSDGAFSSIKFGQNGDVPLAFLDVKPSIVGVP